MYDGADVSEEYHVSIACIRMVVHSVLYACCMGAVRAGRTVRAVHAVRAVRAMQAWFDGKKKGGALTVGRLNKLFD